MQAVDVLLGVDRHLQRQLLEVPGHRQLHDDAVDLRVSVEPADRRQHVVLGDEGGQIDLLGTDPDVGRGLVLGADVDAGGLVVAHEDGGQARDHAPLLQALYPLGYLRADLGRDRLAVDDRGRHGPNPTRGPDRPPKLSDGSGVGW